MVLNFVKGLVTKKNDVDIESIIIMDKYSQNRALDTLLDEKNFEDFFEILKSLDSFELDFQLNKAYLNAAKNDNFEIILKCLDYMDSKDLAEKFAHSALIRCVKLKKYEYFEEFLKFISDPHQKNFMYYAFSKSCLGNNEYSLSLDYCTQISQDYLRDQNLLEIFYKVFSFIGKNNSRTPYSFTENYSLFLEILHKIDNSDTKRNILSNTLKELEYCQDPENLLKVSELLGSQNEKNVILKKVAQISAKKEKYYVLNNSIIQISNPELKNNVCEEIYHTIVQKNISEAYGLLKNISNTELREKLLSDVFYRYLEKSEINTCNEILDKIVNQDIKVELLDRLDREKTRDELITPEKLSKKMREFGVNISEYALDELIITLKNGEQIEHVINVSTAIEGITLNGLVYEFMLIVTDLRLLLLSNNPKRPVKQYIYLDKIKSIDFKNKTIISQAVLKIYYSNGVFELKVNSSSINEVLKFKSKIENEKLDQVYEKKQMTKKLRELNLDRLTSLENYKENIFNAEKEYELYQNGTISGNIVVIRYFSILETCIRNELFQNFNEYLVKNDPNYNNNIQTYEIYRSLENNINFDAMLKIMDIYTIYPPINLMFRDYMYQKFRTPVTFSKDMFEQINKLRILRNNIIHNSQTPITRENVYFMRSTVLEALDRLNDVLK